MKPPRGFTTEAQGTEVQELQESEDRQIVSGQRIDDDDDYVANRRTPKTKLRTLNTKGDSPQRHSAAEPQPNEAPCRRAGVLA